MGKYSQSLVGKNGNTRKIIKIVENASKKCVWKYANCNSPFHTPRVPLNIKLCEKAISKALEFTQEQFAKLGMVPFRAFCKAGEALECHGEEGEGRASKSICRSGSTSTTKSTG